MANAPLQVEVQEVRINPADGGAMLAAESAVVAVMAAAVAENPMGRVPQWVWK